MCAHGQPSYSARLLVSSWRCNRPVHASECRDVAVEPRRSSRRYLIHHHFPAPTAEDVQCGLWTSAFDLRPSTFHLVAAESPSDGNMFTPLLLGCFATRHTIGDAISTPVRDHTAIHVALTGQLPTLTPNLGERLPVHGHNIPRRSLTDQGTLELTPYNEFEHFLSFTGRTLPL